MKSKPAPKANGYQIGFVRRPGAPAHPKVTPFSDDEHYETISVAHTPPNNPMHSLSPEFLAENNKPAATTEFTELARDTPKTTDSTKPKESVGGVRNWFRNLTSKQKQWLLAAIVLIVVLICLTAAIVPPVLVLVVFKTSTSTTSTTTTTASLVISAAWTFDNTTVDTYGIYNGTLSNSATYLAPSTTQPYLGNGFALTLSSASNQSFIVNTPFLNLAYTSFTFEAWIYPTNFSNDLGIFSQCQCSTCTNRCLFMMVRSSKLYMGFLLNDIAGSTTLLINNWYHVAFVYNYAAKQQILYLNGVQDGIVSNASPYQGTNGKIEIGATQAFLSKYYFNGYIDNSNLVTRAKSSAEILVDASLTAYYSFDLPSPNSDSGFYGFNGSSSNTVVANGRVNEAIRFSGSSSYFQVYGFYQFDYSIANSKPFSVSMWINPSSLSSCTFVQVTPQPSTSTCNSLLGIISSTGVSGQLTMRASSSQSMYGPFLTVNVWTHVSLTYSSTNGMTLYVNGILFGSTGSFTDWPGSTISSIVIGYNVGCGCCWYINSAYQGSIDEVYIHSRELTQADVTGLVNV